MPHTGYKRRILENGDLRAFNDLLKDIVSIAQESGVVFGSLQIIDNTHSVANVNVQKDDRRQKKGERPRDPQAHWGVKHTRTVRDEKGQKKKARDYFYGYKLIVLRTRPTSASRRRLRSSPVQSFLLRRDMTVTTSPH